MPTTIRRWLQILPLAAGALGGCAADDGAARTPPVEPAPVSTSAGTTGFAREVDVFIGTGDSNSPDPVPGGAGGSTFPGAALPFGMVQWSPDTLTASPPGYRYTDSKIAGFSLTHLNGAGCAALRDFPVFPSLAAPDGLGDPVDTFAHEDEKASPGLYEVKLGSGILVDLTATARTGLARFTFPDGPDAFVTLRAGTAKDVMTTEDFAASLDGDVLSGFRKGARFCGTASKYQVYFAARFDRPIAGFGALQDGEVAPGATSTTGRSGGLFVRFDPRDGHAVQMKVGLSFVSAEAARANLDAESPGWDFDAVHEAALGSWNGYLGRVAIEGGAADDRTSFYTALYHSLLQPAAFSDVDGSYPGFDGKLKKADAGHVRYANFSGWDVYRSWIHLVSALAPKEASDMVRSLVDSGAECGALPKWSLANDETGVMVGDPSDAIIAGAYAFGARDFDAQAALALMKKGAEDPTAHCNGMLARQGLAPYLSRHYCPIDGPDLAQGPAATTLEYAIADFSIARFADALGDAQAAAQYLERGRYWKNELDATWTDGAATGFVMPRRAADVGGQPSFVEQAPDKTDGFVEGNAAQYTFMVPHDFYGLVEGLGGDAPATARLDALFTQLNAGMSKPYFYMGNEPEFWTPWSYPFVGAPWKTQALVRRILGEAFAPTPGGLPGNDDLGATSAWQVWAMLGLYPQIPGVGGVVIGSPLFPKATLTLEAGGAIVITAAGAAKDAPYVQGLSVSGLPWSKSWIDWSALAGGATLDFTLGAAPNPQWAASAADRPPSFYP